MNTIPLKEALQQMEMLDDNREPQPFSISYWSCDSTRRTGGQLKSIDKAVLTRHVKGMPRHAKGSSKTKRVNEYKNQQRNILDTERPAGRNMYVKVHIRLIDTFNGMKVEW